MTYDRSGNLIAFHDTYKDNLECATVSVDSNEGITLKLQKNSEDRVYYSTWNYNVQMNGQTILTGKLNRHIPYSACSSIISQLTVLELMKSVAQEQLDDNLSAVNTVQSWISSQQAQQKKTTAELQAQIENLQKLEEQVIQNALE